MENRTYPSRATKSRLLIEILKFSETQLDKQLVAFAAIILKITKVLLICRASISSTATASENGSLVNCPAQFANNKLLINKKFTIVNKCSRVEQHLRINYC
jgi:hypothetical protein